MQRGGTQAIAVGRSAQWHYVVGPERSTAVRMCAKRTGVPKMIEARPRKKSQQQRAKRHLRLQDHRVGRTGAWVINNAWCIVSGSTRMQNCVIPVKMYIGLACYPGCSPGKAPRRASDQEPRNERQETKGEIRLQTQQATTLTSNSVSNNQSAVLSDGNI